MLECLLESALGFGCVGHKRFAVCAGDLLRFDSKNPHGGAIDADEFRVQSLMHVRNGRFLKQIAKTFVAFLLPTFQILERALALQLHSGARGKSLHHRQRQRIGWHGFVVKRDEMADNVSVRSSQGHAEVAYGAQVNHALVVGKFLSQPIRHVAHPALGNFHARRAGQCIFKILTEMVVLKKSQRACAKIGQTFRHKRKPHVKSLRQMLHERTEKFRASYRRRSLDDGTQQFLGASGCAGANATQRCYRCRLWFIFG